MVQDFRISDLGNGSSNMLRQEAMWVVNKYGLTESNSGASKVPMMVKTIIMAIAVTMGVIELSIIQESILDKDAINTKDREAIRKAYP